MVYTETLITRPTAYPKDYPEPLPGQHRGPLNLLVAGMKGVDGDVESMTSRTIELVGKYSDNATAIKAGESAIEQLDPGFQERRRKKRLVEWFSAQGPMVQVIDDRDRAGRLRGQTFIFNLTDQKTGLTKIYNQYLTTEEIESRGANLTEV